MTDDEKMKRRMMFGRVSQLLGAMLSALMFGATYGFAADRMDRPAVVLKP